MEGEVGPEHAGDLGAPELPIRTPPVVVPLAAYSVEQYERTPEEQSEFCRQQAIARAAAEAAQGEPERRLRGDNGDEDGHGGVREPRKPIGPTPGESGTAIDE
jgi:hypothetical protein